MSETKLLLNFAVVKTVNGMYTIMEMLGQTPGGMPDGVWNERLACLRVSGSKVGESADLDGVSVFSFVLVRRGRMTVRYQGRQFDLHPGDVHTYAPCMPTKVLEVSDDYDGFCVLIDEQLVYDTPALRHIVRAVYFPTAKLGQPKLAFNSNQADRLAALLSDLRRHILHPSAYQQEAIFSLCALFSIELIEAQDLAVDSHRFTTRAEEVFTAFLRLVPDNFILHRDLQFYADRLNITTTYLSRIVRQMSGRTVVDFLNQSLAAEASLRLKTTNRTITQLADDFHFSDQAAFTKFFTRMKGMSPKEYRKGTE